MYHQQTDTQIKRHRRWLFIAAACVVVVLIVAWALFSMVSANLRAQGELSVRNAILSSAKQCCAIEGSYPSTLDYLEENYGLAVNRSDFAITYEVFADNVMPNVVVLAK